MPMSNAETRLRGLIESLSMGNRWSRLNDLRLQEVRSTAFQPDPVFKSAGDDVFAMLAIRTLMQAVVTLAEDRPE